MTPMHVAGDNAESRPPAFYAALAAKLFERENAERDRRDPPRCCSCRRPIAGSVYLARRQCVGCGLLRRQEGG